MDKPEKWSLDPILTALLGMFDDQCQERGVEAIAFIYSTEAETSVVPNRKFSEREQRIIGDKVLAAILDAGREIEELKKKNVM